MEKLSQHHFRRLQYQLTTTTAPDSVVANNKVNLIPSAASHLVEDNSSNTSPKTFSKVDVLVPKIKQVQKLKALFAYINQHIGQIDGRGFVDSAPVLERT